MNLSKLSDSGSGNSNSVSFELEKTKQKLEKLLNERKEEKAKFEKLMTEKRKLETGSCYNSNCQIDPFICRDTPLINFFPISSGKTR